MLKRFLITLLILLMTTEIALAEQKICVSMASFNDNFLSLVRIAIADAAQEKEDIHLTISDSRWRFDLQKRHIAEFNLEHCNAVILNLVSYEKEDVLPAIQPLQDAGIPIVFVNVKPGIPMGAGLYYVGSNDYESGTLQGKYLIPQLPQNASVAILMGSLFSGVSIHRTQAVKDMLALRPDIKIVTTGIADFERQKAETVVTKWIKNQTQFDAIIANNDEMALGAIQSLKKNGLSPQNIKVIGIDATEEALYSMYKNELYATVFQDAKEQGRQALNIASALAAGSDKLPAEYLIPFQLVTSKNYRIYMRR